MWWNVFFPSSKVSDYFAEGRVEVVGHGPCHISEPEVRGGFKAGEVCFYSFWLYIHSRGLFVHTPQTWQDMVGHGRT
jgi:hypothetical protein